MLTKLMKDMIIPVKELFLRHNVPAYISTSHLEEQNKLGFVLSVKPYDERAEADLYFEAYLKERGLFIGDEEDDIDKIVIRKQLNYDRQAQDYHPALFRYYLITFNTIPF